MLESAELVAFVATSDVPRACTFYEETLGPARGRRRVRYVRRTTLRVTQVAEVAVARTPLRLAGRRSRGDRRTGRRGVVFEHFDGIDQDEDGI